MIECSKDTCKKKYIGQTEHKLTTRMSQHLGYVRNKNLSQPTGYHFNLPGHKISDMKIIILEKKDLFYRKEREQYLIRKFNTYRNGMNRSPY